MSRQIATARRKKERRKKDKEEKKIEKSNKGKALKRSSQKERRINRPREYVHIDRHVEVYSGSGTSP